MQKKSVSRAYKYLRPGFNFLFRLYFNPKKANEPTMIEEGPMIICGNHVDAHDQFMAMIYTKRIINMIAKKEYFEGKAGFFFKMAGCIPIDRNIRDVNAKSEALEILEDGGSIGIFPEGTRNALVCRKEKVEELYNKYFKEKFAEKDDFRKIIKKKKLRTSQINLLEKLKDDNKITEEEFMNNFFNVDSYLESLVEKEVITREEYEDSLLLPFKYGAVSFAEKTNATIVPYANNNNYGFRRKNLKVKFGEPFKIGDMTLVDANKRLRKELIRMILEFKEEEKNEERKENK